MLANTVWHDNMPLGHVHDCHEHISFNSSTREKYMKASLHLFCITTLLISTIPSLIHASQQPTSAPLDPNSLNCLIGAGFTLLGCCIVIRSSLNTPSFYQSVRHHGFDVENTETIPLIRNDHHRGVESTRAIIGG